MSSDHLFTGLSHTGARLAKAAFLSVVLCCGFAAAQTPKIDTPPPPPLPPIRISLAQSDLKPVTLQSVSIETEIVGRLAETTIDLTFFNPNNRVLEGQLQFPLQDGQNVTGFALEMTDGKLREAVPVEKDKGRSTFDDVTRQRIDPALLEVTQGNNYQARVYPLNPGGTRRVQLRYAEVLKKSADGKLGYRLPLAYPDRLKTLAVNIRVADDGNGKPPVLQSMVLGALQFKNAAGYFNATLSKNDFTANELAQIELPQADKPLARTQHVDGKTYFYVEVPPQLLSGLSAGKRALPKSIGLLWDASASGLTRNHNRELAVLDAYFSKIGTVSVELQRIRDVAEPAQVFEVVDGNWQKLRKELETTVYDGATNLGAFNLKAPVDEFLLFSDGLGNYGTDRFTPSDKPLFAILASTIADPTRLRHWAEKSGAALLDLGSDTPEASLGQLLDAAPRLIGMQSNGARELVSSAVSLSSDGFAVAGILTEPKTSVRLIFRLPNGKEHTVDLAIASTGETSSLVVAQWARLRVAELMADYDFNKGEIRRLGKAFGLVTPETSLIVLDRVEDYVRYDIVPPAELRPAFEQMRASANTSRQAEKTEHLRKLAKQWQRYTDWWNRDFPKDNRVQANDKAKISQESSGGVVASSSVDMMAAAPSAPAVRAESTPPPPPVAEASAPVLARGSNEATKPSARRPAMSAPGDALPEEAMMEAQKEQTPTTEASIRLRRWTPDEPYINRMAQAKVEDIYRIYLDERASYTASPAFYLDVADLLLTKGQSELGLRVLSNLAEMNLENRQILRILGYRLLQAKQPALAVAVFKKVLELAQEEPQSLRDLGLAYAEAGQLQEAIDSLWQVAEKPWDARFRDIGLIALVEMNAIINQSAQKLDTQNIDPHLLANLPLDLRVVLTWDTDLTDIDLWVTDPNGERAYYGNPLTYQGGSMSPDCTQGYGPEVFSLKKAKPGVYRIEINFYGERQQLVTGATTIQVKFFTGFGKTGQKEEMVTMRLKQQGEGIFVGDFEVK